MQISHTVYYSAQVSDRKGPHPLLMVLHGFGQVARQFIKVFEPLARKGILVAAPQAAHHFYTHLEEGKVGFSWLTGHGPTARFHFRGLLPAEGICYRT